MPVLTASACCDPLGQTEEGTEPLSWQPRGQACGPTSASCWADWKAESHYQWDPGWGVTENQLPFFLVGEWPPRTNQQRYASVCINGRPMLPLLGPQLTDVGQ